MSSLAMDDRFEPWDLSRRFKVIVIVVVLHAFLGYALISGVVRKGPDFVKKPLEAVVIQEVIIPPPPPPPLPSPPPPKKIEKSVVMPKLDAPQPYVPTPDVVPQVTSTAPEIVSVATPPTAPAVIAPPPPPAAPVAVGPKPTTIGVACPTQVAPEMPRRALQDGTEGVVKAQIHIKGNVIQDVTILSGPRVFHAAVKAAMMQYTCVTDGGEVTATQEFSFKLE